MVDETRVRHSVADQATLLTDPEEIARKEASNALKQAHRVKEVILDALYGDRPFKLRTSLFLNLNKCAIDGLSLFSGVFRNTDVHIQESKHQPPGAHLVPELVEELCDYIQENWQSKTGIHLAAYTLWRTNWIHPFVDGNGRTARAVSHVVLCTRDQIFLPGSKTIPDQIVEHRGGYYSALEDADARYEGNGIQDDTVEALEHMLASMLATQLTDAFSKATGE